MPSSIPRYAERRFGQSLVDLFVAGYSVRVDWGSGVVLANQQYYPAVAGGGSPADTGCRSDLVWSWAAQSDRRLRDQGQC